VPVLLNESYVMPKLPAGIVTTGTCCIEPIELPPQVSKQVEKVLIIFISTSIGTFNAALNEVSKYNAVIVSSGHTIFIMSTNSIEPAPSQFTTATITSTFSAMVDGIPVK